VKVWDGNESGTTAKNSSHHVWVINNIIHGYGQTGVQMNDGEFFYTIHNTIYDNAHATCDAQGSGISYVVLKAFGGYKPTADDKTNPSPLIGSLVTGSSFFHNAVEWNVVYDNALTQCGTASSATDTDGNNIIMDTLNNSGSTGVPYPDATLVAFNVVYNAGGGGVHVFNSEYVTVANNSCFNNYLDPYNNGSERACIDSTGSYGDTFINNIAVAIPASHTNCAYTTAPYAMWNNAFIGSPPSSSATPDTFSNNISDILGGTSCQGEVLMNNGDAYSCTSNKCKTIPGWVNVGTTAAGTETAPPVGVNFALATSSPAIGYGQTQSYLPPQSVDVGACSHTFATCP
jgi:serralysin